MTLQFTPLGVGDAFSTRHYSSSLLVSAQGTTLLIDCPHPIRKMMHEVASTQKPDLTDVDAVVLTHLHADHVSGLEGYLFFSRFLLGRKGTVAAHPLVLADLWDHHLMAGMGRLNVDGRKENFTLADYADTVPLDDTAEISIGPFSIACRRTIHHIPTFALRLTADGVTLAYSADTAYDPTLLTWLKDADLIIHETGKHIHTPYEKLTELPEADREKMRLIHFPDSFDPDASDIECLVQGRRYTVSKSE